MFFDQHVLSPGQIMQRFRAKMQVSYILTIAKKYGYTPDSDAVSPLLDGSLASQALIGTAFSKSKRWHERFDPSSDQHVEYIDGALWVKKFPFYVTIGTKTFGATRADIVRARLGKNWEQRCDRIVVDSHQTTFFEGDTPVVIFYGSGRDSWGRTINALDALNAHAGIVIKETDVFVENNDSFKRIPDLVLTKVNDTWTWPTRQTV